MITVELKPLFQRLNQTCTSALEQAASLAVSRGHYEIQPEHVLLKLLDQTLSDMVLLFQFAEINLNAIKQSLQQSLKELQTGNHDKPSFSPALIEWLQEAWMLSSINYKFENIRSFTLLMALFGRSRYALSGALRELLKPLSLNQLNNEYERLLFESIEQVQPTKTTEQKVASSDNALSQYCEDLTQKAAEGSIDPVLGRESEIRQMVDVLCRRRKNNPILVGEAGVGKTAVVEGLALKIFEKTVPDVLSNVRLLVLDLALLEAGASVKGEFERRLKQVIQEVQSSAQPIILFIDEAHGMIGAGGQQGHDAANLLKPALARGELRTVAATTWQEYKKYFEKDAALSRRFQPIKIDEPDIDNTVLILRGLRDRYEQSHGVLIRDDAICTIATLSSRYITGRQQPDKAVDLLDTCAARVQVSLKAVPAQIEQLQLRLAALGREKTALLRDQSHGLVIDKSRLKLIEKDQKFIERELKQWEQQWADEQVLVQELLAHRQHKSDAKTYRECQRKLDKLHAGNPLLHYEVDPDVVASVVSSWTGVPLGKLLRDESANLLQLESNLKQRIKGQDGAIELIANQLQQSKAGLNPANQPMGVFLLVGPSGVGKTETALTVAETLFGGEESLISINMTEFQERHSISRLIGSPPGYVGYGEGGLLTEAVRQRPYSVVLLDEVEKASLDVMNLFYQVFDKGMLTDGEGRDVSFANTVIFLTSNLATDEITRLCDTHPGISPAQLLKQIHPVLSQWFKPALLARTTVIPYQTLSAGIMGDIVKQKLQALAARLQAQHATVLEYSDGLIDNIVGQCVDVSSGARRIDAILKQHIQPLIAGQVIEGLASGKMPKEIALSYDASGVTPAPAPAAAAAPVEAAVSSIPGIGGKSRR